MSASSEIERASQRERAYFDRVVAEQGDFNPFAERGWQTLTRQFERLVQPRGPLRLLDVGCGTGNSRRIYAAHTQYYLGVDLSERAVTTAQTRFPQSDWFVADARTLPLSIDSFDVVAFSSVLHHIPNYSAALLEALRVLRPGGQVFAFDPNLLHPAMVLFRHPRSPFYLSEGVSPDERPLLPHVLRREFELAGFTEVRQRLLSDIPYRAVAPRLLNACLGLYNLADRFWEWSRLSRLFGTFVLTCARKPVP